jgi:outer membrane protein
MLATLPLLAALAAAPLTLDEALERATAQSPRLHDLQAQIAAGEAQTGATRAHYGPKLRLEANVMVWDSAQELNLAGGGATPQLPAPQQPYDFVVAALLDKLSQPTTVRDQVTASATVQIVQPLVGLYGVSQSADLASLGVDVTRLQVESARRRVSLDVIEAWYRVFQAEALRGAAEKTAASLDAQATRIGQLEANGFVARNEVLRVQAALSAARQRVVEADAAAGQARAALSVAMGEVPGTAYDLAPATPVWDAGAGAAPVPLESVREHALAQRPEVTEVETRIAQAEQGVSVARARMLPDLNLLGQYQHTEGAKFQAEDAFSAGAVLSWTAFEWGATAKQIDVAETQVTRTRAALEQIRAGVALEVEGAWRSHDAAVKALSVAEAGVAQADEALRLTRARFEVQQATTSDVLDAEAALLQARVNLENARYGRVTALARLRYAEGAK